MNTSLVAERAALIRLLTNMREHVLLEFAVHKLRMLMDGGLAGLE